MMSGQCTVIVLHNRDPLAAARGIRPRARLIEVLDLPVDADDAQQACALAADLFGDDQCAPTRHPRYAEDVEVYWTYALRALQAGDVVVVDTDGHDRRAFARVPGGWEEIPLPTWGAGCAQPPRGTAGDGTVWRAATTRRPRRRRSA
jgi:hypothetical protein